MRLFDIIRKDVLVVLRDIKALIFILIMPIVIIVILSFALGGVFTSNGVSAGSIHVAVIDETESSETEAVLKQLSQYTGGQIDMKAMSLYSILDSEEVSTFLSYENTDAASAKKMLENGKADAVVTIPKGTTMGLFLAMMGEGGAEIRVEGSGNSALKAGIAKSIVQAWADTVSSISADMGVLLDSVAKSGQMSQQVVEKLDIESFIKQTTNASVNNNASVNTVGINARKGLDSFLYYSIAITCMFILYSAGQGSTFLYDESEERTLQRLMAAGISRRKLLLGKAFAVFCLCAIQLIVLFAFSALVLGVDWGNSVAFIAISLCVAISVTGLGVLLMVLVYRSGNPRIGSTFQAILVQVFALFGGSFIPLSVLPPFFSTVSLITPNGLAIHAYTENATGAPFAEILPYMLGCIAVGVVLGVLGAALFPRERRA